jgi:transposase-like protein
VGPKGPGLKKATTAVILMKSAKTDMRSTTTMVDPRMDALEWLRKQLAEECPDIARAMLERAVAELMSAEADALCGAPYGERSPERVNARNGYRSRRWDTRAGTIELEIPKLRSGSYFPDWLIAPRRRAEKALVAAIADAYLAGVSTRRVDKLVRTLGIEGISRSQVSQIAKGLDEAVEAFRARPLVGPFPYVWLDALVVRCRDDRMAMSGVCCMVAVGVNACGRREVLGVELATSEDGAGWTGFLRGLAARGLSGVQLVISDAHQGLVEAARSVIAGAAWQRCRTHYLRNLLTKVPKSAQPLVATLVRSIFAQPDAAQVIAQHERVVDQLAERFAAAAAHLAEAAPELLAFTSFPKEHWRQIWSTNPQERLNKEIRRRTDVVGTFPDRASVLRLVGAVLAETHDEWADTRRYMTVDALLRPDPVSETKELLLEQAA